MQVCLAVEYAHNRGVIHRDLKPTNIMLGDFGEVYVLDWGLAKLTHASVEEAEVDRETAETRPTSPEMTTDGDLLGTPLYMAPEQLRGRHATVDARTDVFALGTILFEVLTLQPLRADASLGALLSEVDATTKVERASARTGDVPAELDDLCAGALEREPAARIASARALADAVARYLEGDRDLAARRAHAAKLLESARGRLHCAERGRDRHRDARGPPGARALAG